jgi:hypothetical protein
VTRGEFTTLFVALAMFLLTPIVLVYSAAYAVWRGLRWLARGLRAELEP